MSFIKLSSARSTAGGPTPRHDVVGRLAARDVAGTVCCSATEAHVTYAVKYDAGAAAGLQALRRRGRHCRTPPASQSPGRLRRQHLHVSHGAIGIRRAGRRNTSSTVPGRVENRARIHCPAGVGRG